jgi:D-alanyl-D-alanine carboxypeptidase (penicillin-binding protein 5/6)
MALPVWAGLLIVILPARLLAAPLTMPEPPQLDAGGYILMDFHTGEVLAEHNADEQLAPASLTKIMTAYVVFEELASDNLRLDDPVLVSERAWRTGGSKMFIEVGKRVRVEDLLKGMIVQSGNDASVALAEHIAGTESTFADMMNAQARRLGMNGSQFTNAPGLPAPEHYTTPRDMAILARALIRDFPDYYQWYSQEEFTYNEIRQRNRNTLLRQDPSVDGVKTGHTSEAGYCLVASAQRDGQRMISVVMKTDSTKARARDSLALLNYGFRFFETLRLYQNGEVLGNIRIWKGASTELPVGSAVDLYVSIPRGAYESLSTRLVARPDILAPVERGEQVGDLLVAFNGQDIRQVPLVALESIPKGGLSRQAIDTVLQWWQ